MKSQEIGKTVDLHNVEFYNLAPRAIHHLKSDIKLGLLALARADNTIEIWNIESESPIMVKTIFPMLSGKIEGLCWVQEQLFTVDSEGQLISWDLKTLAKRKVMRVTGNSGTCIDTNADQSLIVVGTEEGYLNLFSVTEENGVLYEKLLDKQDGRVVCVKFDPSGKFLATGNLDCVRIWDISTGHVIHKMSVSRAEAKKPTIVWCIAVLDHLEIITGDSRGRITIWDGKVGAQVQSLVASKADIISLAVTKNNKFYCAGSDADIRTFTLVTLKKDDGETRQWVRTSVTNLHTHDVLALDLYHEMLYSGGQDTFLICSSYPPKVANRYTPLLPKPSVSVVENRLIFFKHFNYIEVWRLGAPDSTNIDSDNEYLLAETPKKILALKSKYGTPIIDACVSSNSEWICYTTDGFSKMFQFRYKENQQPELLPVELPEEFENARLVKFLPCSTSVCVTKPNNTIIFFNINSESGLILHQSVDVSKQIDDTIRQLHFSNDGQHLACLSATSDIILYKLQKKKWNHLLNLPKHTSVATCIGFRPNSNKIVAAFADHKLFEYDFKEANITMSTNVCFGNNRYPIAGLVFDSRKDDVILLETELGVFMLKKMGDDEDDDGAGMYVKRTKAEKMFRDVDNKTCVKNVKKYEHLMHLSWMGEQELVAVHATTLQFVEQLPPAFRKKKFEVS